MHRVLLSRVSQFKVRLFLCHFSRRSSAGGRCRFVHENCSINRDDASIKSNDGHVHGACYDCGEKGHSIGDNACLKPNAALNFPSWAQRFIKPRGSKNNEKQRSNGKRKRDSDDASEFLKSIREDSDKEDEVSDHKRRIAALESKIKSLIDERDGGASWRPLF